MISYKIKKVKRFTLYNYKKLIIDLLLIALGQFKYFLLDILKKYKQSS